MVWIILGNDEVSDEFRSLIVEYIPYSFEYLLHPSLIIVGTVSRLHQVREVLVVRCEVGGSSERSDLRIDISVLPVNKNGVYLAKWSYIKYRTLKGGNVKLTAAVVVAKRAMGIASYSTPLSGFIIVKRLRCAMKSDVSFLLAPLWIRIARVVRMA